MAESTSHAERIAVLEAEVKRQADMMKAMDQKLDQILAAANMGKGAWWLILRIGGTLTVVAAIVTAILNGIRWFHGP